MLHSFNQFLHILRTLFWLFVFISFCLLALADPNNYDFYYYHQQSIRWLNEFPITLGLGNLFSKLAFNQSFFSFIALINFYPVSSHGNASAGIFMILLSLICIYSISRSISKSFQLLAAGLIFLTFSYSNHLSYASPDFALNCLEIISFLLLLTITQKTASSTINLRANNIALISICMLMLTVKLSSIFFALSIIGIIFFNKFNSFKLNNRSVQFIIIWSCLFLMVHVLRSYLLSGAPFYPSSLAILPNLPWSMSIDAINNESNWTMSWARKPFYQPNEVLGNWQYYLPWMKDNWIVPWAKSLPIWIIFCYLGSILFLLATIFSAGFTQHNKKVLIIFIPLIATTFFWFFTAPDPRFLGPIPWLSLFLSIFVFYRSQKMLQLSSSRVTRFYILFVPILCSIMLLGYLASSVIYKKSLPPPREQDIILNQRLTMNGILIFTPEKNELCGNSPLPCTPHLGSSLTGQTVYHRWWMFRN